jgi:hypothetical protein
VASLIVIVSAAACAAAQSPAQSPVAIAAPTPSVSASTPAPSASASSAPAWQTRAASYLDARAVAWLDHPLHVTEIPQNFTCAMTCHSTHPFVVARAALPGGDALSRVRGAIESRVGKIESWATTLPMYGDREKKLGRWSIGAEAVMNASALALGDRTMGRAPTLVTMRAVDLMWSAQRTDGAWDWFEFELEPWEAGGDIGVAMASLAVSALPPEGIARGRVYIARMHGYVAKRLADTAKPMSLHDRVLLLWASGQWKELLGDADRAAIAKALVEHRRDDGGFSFATWGRGKLARNDGASDGYATALAALALCETHADDATAARAIAWLRGAQRDDGSWPARSVNANKEPNDGFMTDAATAYAALALTRCR